VHKGALVSVAVDLFRLDGVPPSRHHLFTEAVLRAGPGAYLSHDAVLALHELTDHLPQRVRVGSPHRRPVTCPDHVEVFRRVLPPGDLTTYQGIRSATVARALLDSRPLLAPAALEAAAGTAVRRGLLLRRERHALLEALAAG
jgi:hypothetical protein